MSRPGRHSCSQLRRCRAACAQQRAQRVLVDSRHHPPHAYAAALDVRTSVQVPDLATAAVRQRRLVWALVAAVTCLSMATLAVYCAALTACSRVGGLSAGASFVTR